ncbi:MAG: alpha/beta hydrolase [Chitinophagaceae bacterium]|nr:MAG: alpha/beta hydrolase [Chitinophagaceae bacterium]
MDSFAKKYFMQIRLLLQVVMIFLAAQTITKAQAVKSFEISGYPELDEIESELSPSSSPANFVGKIRLNNGITLEYAESGNPRGTPVIFLHGFTDSRHSFNYLVPKLTGDIRSIVLTQRGHGQSDKPEAGYKPEDFAADLDAFMTAQNLDKAIIVGHSLGSTVAQCFALNYPSKVTGLALLATVPQFSTNPALVEFGAQVALLKDPVDHAFASDFQKSTIQIPISASYLDSLINETLKVPSLVWKSVISGLLEVDYTPRLKTIKAPALVLYGDKDNFSSVGDQHKFSAAIAGSTLKVYEGVGHAIHWEDPDQTAIDLSAFIKKITQINHLP